MKMNAKAHYPLLFILALLLSLFLKLPALSMPLADDEGQWGYVVAHGSWSDRFQQIPHPPLAMLIYVFFHTLHLPLKLVPLLFSAAGLFFLYLALRKLYPERIAFLTGVTLLLSPLAAVSSLQLDIDGGLLLFFVSLLFYIETSLPFSSRKIFLIGIVSGFTLLLKYTAVIFLLLFWLKLLYDASLLKESSARAPGTSKRRYFLLILCSGVCALFIFSLFPLIAWFLDFSFFTTTLAHGSLTFSGYYHTAKYLGSIFGLLQTIILVGPLCILAAFFSYPLKKDALPSHVLFSLLSLAFVFLLYIFLPSAAKPYERYLSPLLIPLGFLIAHGYSKMKIHFSLKNIFIVLASFFALWLTHFLPFSTISFEKKMTYLIPGLFFVPFRGASGPFGFYVNSLVIYLLLILLATVFILSLRRKSIPTYFLFVSLAFCLIINAEFLYALTTPNTSVANSLLDDPIEGNYLAHRKFGVENYNYTQQLYDTDLFSVDAVQPFFSTNTTVILLNFPPYHNTALSAYLDQHCEITIEAMSKGVLIGKRYFCDSGAW